MHIIFDPVLLVPWVQGNRYITKSSYVPVHILVMRTRSGVHTIGKIDTKDINNKVRNINFNILQSLTRELPTTVNAPLWAALFLKLL